MLNLVDKKVTHKVFGEGKVLSQNGDVVEIGFNTENKKFIYPDAFDKYLVVHDAMSANVLKKIIRIQNEKLEAHHLQQEEHRVLQREKQKLRMEYDRITNNHKLHDESQMVFWCTEEEAENALKEWTVFTGMTKSGANKGKINKATRLHRNSAVVITGRDGLALEQNRHVLGVYMVEGTFVGKRCEDGNIKAHTKYKLSLTKEESEQLLFWKYYSNKKTPDKITWNTGKYRYFDNEWMAQLLVDIVAIKTDVSEKQIAQQFLSYFCKMNQITLQDLQLPNGSLLRKV